MEHKNIVATIYIKDGMAVKSPTELDDKSDVLELASVYDDSGIDKIICYDLSTDDEEHEKNILAIREINRNIQVKTAGGGNIKRLEDEVDRKEREYQQNHVDRMTRGECKPEGGMIFSDVISGLERVADHATNIAFAMYNNDNY